MKSKPKVSIVMGSKSDYPTMKFCEDILKKLKVKFETNIVSAHRTADKMMSFGKSAHENGIDVIIAGAGGAAHRPGMVASISPLPVIGVPVKSSNSIDGWDSVLSILQMPGGVPVATVALNGAKNAALLACQILGVKNPALREAMIAYKVSLGEKVHQSAKDLNNK